MIQILTSPNFDHPRESLPLRFACSFLLEITLIKHQVTSAGIQVSDSRRQRLGLVSCPFFISLSISATDFQVKFSIHCSAVFILRELFSILKSKKKERKKKVSSGGGGGGGGIIPIFS